MASTRLNLAALRGDRLPRPYEAALTLAEVMASKAETPISRRQLLGLAGAAAVAAPPTSRAIESAALGSFELVSGPERAAFRLGGEERWVIDARRFGGSPKLAIEKGDDLIRIRLSGAKYPGTSLPADMVCELRRGIVGWRMKLWLALGGFVGEGSFERWLIGDGPARADVRLRQRVCELKPGARVALEGRAEAEFLPEWVLRLRGSEVGSVTGLGEGIAADAVTIALLSDEAPSIVSDPAQKRTLVSLERGEQRWTLEAASAAPKGTALLAAGSLFDVIHIEAGEDRMGLARRALLARANDDASRLSFQPFGELRGDDGKPFALPLRDARYAVAFDPSGQETALVANFDKTPVWMHADGYSLQLGDASGEPGFELVRRDGRAERLRCEPALLGMAAPLRGAIVEPAAAVEEVRADFVGDGTRIAQRRPPVIRLPKPKPKPKPPVLVVPPAVKPKPPVLVVPPAVKPKPPVLVVPPAVKPKPPIIVAPRPPVKPRPDVVRPGPVIVRPDLLPMKPFVVSVVRPEDLLALDFRFMNLALKTEAGMPARLQRIKANEPAYIAVSFRPQHIGEEAFAESAPEFPGMAGAMDTDELAPPPVGARLSGPSRLVFKLPEGTNEIPYTLESLLDWSRFELSVAPTALPPPPPRFVLPAGAVPMPSRPGSRPGLTIGRRRPATTAIQPRAARATALSIQPAASGLLSRRTPAVNIRPDIVATPLRVLPRPVEPTAEQTAIEAPYRLIISPNELAGWVHAIQPVTRDGATELWHTRLGVKSRDGTVFDRQYEYGFGEGEPRVIRVSLSGDDSAHYRTVRAIWSSDYSTTLPSAADVPFTMSLDRRDRCELVWLTADFRIPGCRERIVEANRLMLTSLGAWMNVRYAAEVPLGKDLTVEEWRHQATMGRDQYVKVVYKGYLFPFGHQASLIKVTERKFERMGGGSVAYLRQRFFIVVREPVKEYPAHGQPLDGRRMPLRTVRVTTLVTPTLDTPGDDNRVPGVSASARSAFWPRVNGKEFQFHISAEDWAGKPAEFTTPMIFVDASVAFKGGPMQTAVTHFNAEATRLLRQRDMFGQSVAFADTSGAKAGDTSLEATSITFGAELPASLDAGGDLTFEQHNQPRFYPTMAQAQVRIPAVVQMTGQDTPVRIELEDAYVDNAWNAAQNAGQVFVRLVDAAGNAAPTGLAFPTDKSGGLAAPDMSIGGLSRKFGPVSGSEGDGGLANFAGGDFNPADFFKGAGAKLLGAIDLWEIISSVFGDVTVPNMTVDTVEDENGLPIAVQVKYDWTPKVKNMAPLFLAEMNGAPSEFTLHALLETPLTGGEATYNADVTLTNFTVDLSFIIAKFNMLKFVAGSGKKADVDVGLEAVEFAGPLSFIETFREYLSSGQLGGFAIDIQPTHVSVGYTLSIPNVAVGVLSIQNISLSATIRLSFLNDPVELRFAFCSREDPFMLTVSLFGGGGFFAITVLPDGVKIIEASFEFGGNFAFDIGVASGGVYIMAGIYFKYELGDCVLTGYVRMGGELSILGLIRISLEFYLGLTYESAGNRVWGQAKLTVEIEILFFSIGVTLTVEKQFAGSSSGSHAESLDGVRLASLDGIAQLRTGPGRLRPPGPPPPSIADLMDLPAWQEYCGAFG